MSSDVPWRYLTDCNLLDTVWPPSRRRKAGFIVTRYLLDDSAQLKIFDNSDISDTKMAAIPPTVHCVLLLSVFIVLCSAGNVCSPAVSDSVVLSLVCFSEYQLQLNISTTFRTTKGWIEFIRRCPIGLKVRSIGKSWTRDYQDHVISWWRLHDFNGTQHKSHGNAAFHWTRELVITTW